MKNPSKAELSAFRKLAPEAQAKQLIGTRVERVLNVEREAVDAEKRTVWSAASSEQPYERWWGIEVLDHGAKSIRASRLKSGMAVLIGHDSDKHVGIVDKFEIAADRKLRVLTRFGSSALAEEKFRDVSEGILVQMSIGYIIHDLVLEKSEDGVNTYRVTDWEPYEVSYVAVAADPTVGVGRELEPEAPITERKPNMSDKDTPKQPTAEEVTAQATQRELARVNEILAAGDAFKADGGEELARELVRDPKATVATFNSRILEKLRGKQKPTPTAEPTDTGPTFGSGARVLLRHSPLRAFRTPLVYSDGSKMESQECAYRAGQWLLATIGQSQKAAKWCAERGIVTEQRVMTTETGSVGGYLVPDEMEQQIIDLRVQYGLARRLCRRRPMSTDTLSVPKRTGGVTAYFVNEDNSGVTASDKSWGNVNFVAKTLAALSLISKNLAEDSIIDVVDDLAMEQAYAFATKEDQCWLIGDGTSTYAGMRGLTHIFDNDTLASGITAASTHDTFAEYDNTDLSAVMAGVADFPGMNPSWVCSKTFAENVFGRLKRSAGGNTGGDLDRRYVYGYGGYPADTSDIMPKVGTSAVTTTEALFGDFSKSSSFADRRGIMVEVLRERYAEKLQIGILSHERFHIINHDVGDSSNKGPVAALKGE
jgi:HK97 family phage major capsid protein/HK97 family phage prohead protease